jgi:hypothetical protein
MTSSPWAKRHDHIRDGVDYSLEAAALDRHQAAARVTHNSIVENGSHIVERAHAHGLCSLMEQPADSVIGWCKWRSFERRTDLCIS